jgi:hypothetical protein
MDPACRRFVGWAVGAYAVSLVLCAVVIGHADRLPMPPRLPIVGLAVAQVAVGFVIGRWSWLPLGVCPALPALVAGLLAHNVLFLAVAVPVVVPLGLALTALGIGARKMYERRRRFTRGRVIAVASILPLALALAIGVIDHNRTVRAERPRPVVIDERAGRIGPIGLGDTANRVESRLGHAPPGRGNGSVEPLDASFDAVGSPSSIDGPPGGNDHFVLYPKYAFWIGSESVYSIETIDKAARTSRGVGVGDSIELVKRAYPELDCGEDSVGSDEPIPYPYCAGRTGPRTWIYFGGDYTQPGTPVTAITLLPHPF